MAGAAFLHVSQSVLRAQEGAAQVGLDDLVPEIHVHVPDQRPAGDAPGEVRHDGGIVHQHVDVPEPVDHLVERPPDRLLVPDVRVDAQGIGQLSQLGAGLVEPFLAHVDDDHLGLLSRERQRGVASDALAASRDHDHFAFQHFDPPSAAGSPGRPLPHDERASNGHSGVDPELSFSPMYTFSAVTGIS